MAFPSLSGSRRGRVVVFAIISTILALGFMFSGPSPGSRFNKPYDLHQDLPETPGVVLKPQPYHPSPYIDPPLIPAAEVTHDSGDVKEPPVSANEDEINHVENDWPEVGGGGNKPTTVQHPTTNTESTVSAETTEATERQTVITDTIDATETANNTEPIASDPSTTLVCPDFESLQKQKPGPLSDGRRQFPYVRPRPECRTFHLPALERMLGRLKGVIRDPDLFRLFENSYPNTLDTMVKWRGYANKTDHVTGEVVDTDEELTYVTTGDIDAMWLRDSAGQVYSYLPFLEASEDHDSLASLWRGLINSHSRYILTSPYCHSFQPPPESGIPPTVNPAYEHNHPEPVYDPNLVFDCKWELDSLASFLQISSAYYTRTGDLSFFGKYSWVDAVEAAVDASAAMRLGTYDKDGRVQPSAWTFTGWTHRGTETLTNAGRGNPVKENGMVRSAFRPSDDACIFQLLTPSNMMWAAYLEQASEIMQALAGAALNNKAASLTVEMRKLAKGIRRGIAQDAVVVHRDFGKIFAYEVDGYGGANLMDDANIPSLLAMPLWRYSTVAAAKPSGRQAMKAKLVADNDGTTIDNTELFTNAKPPGSTARSEKDHNHDYAEIYQNTRRFVLSMANPYFANGPVLSAVGSPHLGPGKAWPLAAIVAALTAFEGLAGFDSREKRDEVVAQQLFAVLNSTAGAGVIHEATDAWNERRWSRSWFGWANGLFGELILRIVDDEENRGVLGEKGGLLGRMWQD
ncbi:hypothetical protein B0J18DRAFT_14676 [Chaetomium sp. MPI-SDFR-AT-0129]|nr:hypothetical protein B0J18DRAFT_14676 [Chaetomium sp. MPI-SDFR-AT-0129]